VNSIKLMQRFPWLGKLEFGEERMRHPAAAERLQAEGASYESTVARFSIGRVGMATKRLVGLLFGSARKAFDRADSTVCLVVLAILSSLPSVAVAQGAECWICEPRIVLEPAAFARNVDADAGDVDFLVRVHMMAGTAVPRLGISMVVQWIVPHGNSPVVMAHLSYALLDRPVSVAPFVGVMNTRFKGEAVIKPMTALYVTAPSGLRHIRVYGLWTVMFADGVVPSLALGLRLPLAPVPPRGGM